MAEHTQSVLSVIFSDGIFITVNLSCYDIYPISDAYLCYSLNLPTNCCSWVA
jgi:hypothetical protein